ncbi:MAG: hypothetical protein WCD89_21335 [Anaerocolumna sp.]
MIKRRMASITLVGILAIITPMSSLAAEKTGSTVKDRSTYSVSALYKSALDTLVTEGTISSAQEEAIIDTMPSRGDKSNNRSAAEANKKPASRFERLVTAGTITEEQLTAIETALKTAKETDRTIEDILDSLVTDGIITTTQEEAIMDGMPSIKDRSLNRDTSDYNKKPTSRFESLVTAGTITEDQLTVIEAALKSAKESDKSMQDILDSLVTDGTITSAQEEAITSNVFLKNGKAGNSMNDKAGKKNRITGQLESLVTTGTITEDQLTAIQTALKAALESTFKSN